jgi:pimeloyl-ACP methyl ester carboxylesterase
MRREGLEWREAMQAKLRAGEDPLAVTRSMYDKDRPGTFDSLPELRRRILTDNARTMDPFLFNLPHQARFGCDEARKLGMPVLLIEGERTDDEMRAIGTAALGCLPDARRVVLPGAGHAIQFDAPEAMAREVASFAAK